MGFRTVCLSEPSQVIVYTNRQKRQNRSVGLDSIEIPTDDEARLTTLARGGPAGESGVEVGEGVALDLAVGFFSGAELGDGSHFA
jgi:hypothetical protein